MAAAGRTLLPPSGLQQENGEALQGLPAMTLLYGDNFRRTDSLMCGGIEQRENLPTSAKAKIAQS
jgi:hypothetical protein